MSGSMIAGVMAIETCEDAIYKKAILRHSPSDGFNPINWNGDDWRDYAKTYVLPSSAVSIALCGLVVVALVFYLVWRMVKLCCCASHSSDPYRDLTSRWLLVQKCLVVTLGVLAIAGAIVGMVMMEHGPVDSVRIQAQFAFNYTDRVLDSVDSLLADARAVVPALGSAQAVLSDVNTPSVVSSMQCTQQLLDSVPSIATTRATLVAIDAEINPSLRDNIGAVTQRMGNATLQLAPSLASMYGADALFQDIYSTINGYSQALSNLPTDKTISLSAVKDLQRAQKELDRNSATWDGSLSDLTAALQFYTSYQQSNALLLTAAQARQLTASADYLRLDLLPPLSSALRSFSNLCASLDSGCVNDAINAINYVNTTVVRLDGDIASAMSKVDDMRAQAGPLCNVGSSNRSSGNPSITELSQEFDTLVQSLVAPDGLANMISMAEEAGNTIASGPDSASVESSIPLLQSSLRQLQPLAAGIASATDDVLSAPTDSQVESSYAALLVAAAGASSPVAALVGYMGAAQGSSFLAWTSSLSLSLDAVNSLDSVMGGLQDELMSVQEQLSPAPVGSYPKSIQPYLDALDSLAGLDDLPQPKSQVLTPAINTIRSLDVDSTKALSDIEVSVNSAISSFGDDFLRQLRNDLAEARRLEALYVGKGQHYYSKYGWKAWLGVYAAFIALVLLVMLFSVFACPGGLCAALLLLLAYLIFYMIIPIGLTAGEVTLQDGCWQVEAVALREVADNPDIDALVNFYLYGRNDNLEAVLLQAGIVSIPEVRQSLYGAQDLIRNVTGDWTPGWKLAPAVDTIRSAVDQVLVQLDDMLATADFEPVHDAYVQLKASACCNPGDFLFTQFLCMTVSGMVCWAMALTAFFILWKLDRLPRSTCCGFQCYRAKDYEPAKDDVSPTSSLSSSVLYYVAGPEPLYGAEPFYKAADPAKPSTPPVAVLGFHRGKDAAIRYDPSCVLGSSSLGYPLVTPDGIAVVGCVTPTGGVAAGGSPAASRDRQGQQPRSSIRTGSCGGSSSGGGGGSIYVSLPPPPPGGGMPEGRFYPSVPRDQ